MSGARVIAGDCVIEMTRLEAESVDAVITDPPYDLLSVSRNGSRRVNNPDTPAGRTAKGFMGKTWDATGVAFKPETWEQALRVLKPGGHLLSFGGTRTFHRMIVAIEDAGFEIRDCLSWLYGTGFPKSLNLDDVQPGSGTALKPAWEPIILARKPLGERNVAANVRRWGTGALNIDVCRIEYQGTSDQASAIPQGRATSTKHSGAEPDAGRDLARQEFQADNTRGRWPANVALTHSSECVSAGTRQVAARVINRFDDGAKPFGGGAGHPYTAEVFGDKNGQETVEVWSCVETCPVYVLDKQTGPHDGMSVGELRRGATTGRSIGGNGKHGTAAPHSVITGYGDTGSVSRFFYTSKASTSERNERTRAAGLSNSHPTVKPLDLMRWLCRLVTPAGGLVLDPFAGSGSTLVAALMEGFDAVGFEITPEYVPIIQARLDGVQVGLL